MVWVSEQRIYLVVNEYVMIIHDNEVLGPEHLTELGTR
jgi:hypothetical protein